MWQPMSHFAQVRVCFRPRCYRPHAILALRCSVHSFSLRLPLPKGLAAGQLSVMFFYRGEIAAYCDRCTRPEIDCEEQHKETRNDSDSAVIGPACLELGVHDLHYVETGRFCQSFNDSPRLQLFKRSAIALAHPTLDEPSLRLVSVMTA